MEPTVSTSPEHARALLEWYRRHAQPLLAKRQSAHLETLEKQAGELERMTAVAPAAEVAFLGSTTAGKSTTINALLGQRILPENRIGSTTAARVILRYGPTKRFVVRYSSEEQVEADLRRLASDWDDIDGLAAALGEEPNYQPIERLRSLARSALGLPPNHRLVRTDLDRPLPTDIQALFGREVAYTSDIEQAVNEHIVGRYWAIVADAAVELPHPLLSMGLTIVDLPGTGDTDQGRLAALQAYVNRAHQFVLVLGIALVTDDVEALLVQTDLMLKLMAHRRPLIVAGTKLDTAGVPTPEDIANWGVDPTVAGLRAVEAIWRAKAAHKMQELMRRLVYRVDPKRQEESEEEYDARVRTHFDRSEYIALNPRAALELDVATRGTATEAALQAWHEHYPTEAALGVSALRQALADVAGARRAEYEKELGSAATALASLAQSELETPPVSGDAEILEALLGRCDHEVRQVDSDLAALFNHGEELTACFVRCVSESLDKVASERKLLAIRVETQMKSVNPATARASVRSSRNGVWNKVHVPKALFETVQLRLIETWKTMQNDLTKSLGAHEQSLDSLCGALERILDGNERSAAALASVARSRVAIHGHCESARREFELELGQVGRLTDEVLTTARRGLAAPCSRAATIRGAGATAAIITVVAGESSTVCSGSAPDIKAFLQKEAARLLDAWKRLVVDAARRVVHSVGDDLRRTLGSGADAAMIDQAEADVVLLKLPAPFGAGPIEVDEPATTRDIVLPRPSEAPLQGPQNQRDLGVLDEMFAD